jgi:hypothetical protein
LVRYIIAMPKQHSSLPIQTGRAIMDGVVFSLPPSLVEKLPASLTYDGVTRQGGVLFDELNAAQGQVDPRARVRLLPSAKFCIEDVHAQTVGNKRPIGVFEPNSYGGGYLVTKEEHLKNENQETV